ncbi:MAG: DNA mismatch repair protein MutS [Proteobacteria bacterium]|nr:DNA mismatch repair protein MutS [Pseudomonadota bacterium]
MKAHLMHKDLDFAPDQSLPWNAEALIKDLGLAWLLDAMASGDKYVREISETVLLCSLDDVDAILYRQNVLRDGLAHEEKVRELYRIADDAISQERSGYWSWFTPRYPMSILHRAVDTLEMLLAALRRLRLFADTNADVFRSEGIITMLTMLRVELTEEYLASIEDHLRRLRFRDGVEISARLGKGNRLVDIGLRDPPRDKRCWLRRVFGRRPPFSYQLNPRDESGARALMDLKERGIDLAANALAQSTDHILSFFQLLRAELAFYLGCLNLRRHLEQTGLPVCIPSPHTPSKRVYLVRDLYDPSLAIRTGEKVVGNDVRADGMDLIMITGANQGGKSTFLRSVGIAQLMMQAGMFVPASAFQSEISSSVVTHYKREEDTAMESGKLDEELRRMDKMVPRLRRDALVLFNESFAATNEREGSEIASEITYGLIQSSMRVFFVTHLYEFAHRLYGQKLSNAKFLRAQRLAGGTRTFRMLEGQPLQTSYGRDLYERVFAEQSRKPKPHDHAAPSKTFNERTPRDSVTGETQ